jgi:hypothetical protein
VEQVIQTRTIPDEESGSPAKGMETDEYMGRLNEEQWRDHIVYLYRKFPPPPDGASRTYIAKFAHNFDEEWIQKMFGGGTFHYILKKGSQRLKEGDMSVDGPPRQAGTAAAGAAQSDTIRAMELLLEKMKDPERQFNFDLMKQAMLNSLEIQRAAAAPPMSLKDMTDAMVNLKKLSGEGDGMPAWLSELGKTFSAALVPLVTALLQPKDPLTTIKGTVETMAALQSINGGGGSGREDLSSIFIRNAPSLLSEGSKFLAELRAADEVKRQNMILARSNPAPIVPAVHVMPAAAAPAAPLAAGAAPETAAPVAVDQSGIQEGRPDPAWVFSQVVKMCMENQPGGFAHDFLDQIDPAFMNSIRQATLEQLRLAIQNDLIHPVLKQMMAAPRFEEFLKEFHEALKAGQPQTTVAVN